MFYSHEILTSPEHGVATIWLVATLGSRSFTRKLNRKTILDVDVPKACDVIVNPQVPMALRLQGSLLYGVSKVYSQQCGYALMDAQTMLDRMKSILKVIHGTGIDPSAGKARPDHLILPYDPSFLPEIDLLSINFELSKFDLQLEEAENQESSLLWAKSPGTGRFALPQADSLQLEIPSDNLLDFANLGSEINVNSSVQKAGHLGRALGLDFGNEEGILLQADFEFDEDGNIVELDGPWPTDSQKLNGREHSTEIPHSNAVKFNGLRVLDRDDERATPNGDAEDIRMHDNTVRASVADARQVLAEPEIVNDRGRDLSHCGIKMPQSQRKVKVLPADSQIALRNTELAQWNNEYLQNMTAAAKQKQNKKLPTLTKKNAAFWVFGQGIGSVGVGLGMFREPHPLRYFSGDELYALFKDGAKSRGQKRDRSDDCNSETGLRRVRPKMGEDQGYIGLPDEIVMQEGEDPEIGRHAPVSVRDDQSFQMPWNITASIQSSRHGSSAAHRGLSGTNGLLHRGLSDYQDASGQLRGSYPRGSRLTSASPLAGRGLNFDLESMPFLGSDGELAGLDFDLYLQGELDPGRHRTSTEGLDIPIPSSSSSQFLLPIELTASSLGQESQNFLEFLNTKADNDSEAVFSALLPPQRTSRIVATNALMHVLALATEGFLSVHQEPYISETNGDLGMRYRYGEIFISLREG